MSDLAGLGAPRASTVGAAVARDLPQLSGATRRVSYRMATLSRDDGEREDSQ
ncbi:hypothetical protein [[Mycobacterium] holstebronense]|uniref:Uncharacterized protein n=1 Tax=[Mycobacterium] holstebronense TaxID=3064288 RepID=A0ABM9M4X5_9MYCO|nr:hypothetical protein [Mycolicibacter sp. MU0102]CAJ1510211.1 hypothetical protein MU0102_004055 [Mycolicibacter sp. MU0102]